MESEKVLFSSPFLHYNYIPWISALRSAGIDVAFVTLSETMKFDDSIKVYHLSHRIGTIAKMFYVPSILALIKILRNERPDVVILRELSMTNIMLSWLSKTFFRAKVIYYDQLGLTQEHIFRKLGQFLISRTLMTTADDQVGRIHSDLVSSELLSYKSRYLLPFCFPCQVSKRDIDRKLAQPLQRLKIITTAKFREKRKNIGMLVVALRELLLDDAIELTIVGKLDRGDCPNYLELSRLCQSLTEQGAKIEILPNLTQPEVFEEYRKAHIFILPSVDEPASVSQFEAMAHGLPIIVTNRNGTQYCVQNGVNGFVIGAEVDQIRKVVDGFLCGEYDLVEFSIAALEVMKAEYSPEVFLEKFDVLCNKAKGAAF